MEIEDISKIEDIRELKTVSKKYKKEIIKYAVSSVLVGILGIGALAYGTSLGLDGSEALGLSLIIFGSVMGLPAAILADIADKYSNKRRDVKDKIKQLTPLSKDEYYII